MLHTWMGSMFEYLRYDPLCRRNPQAAFLCEDRFVMSWHLSPKMSDSGLFSKV